MAYPNILPQWKVPKEEFSALLCDWLLSQLKMSLFWSGLPNRDTQQIMSHLYIELGTQSDYVPRDTLEVKPSWSV